LKLVRLFHYVRLASYSQARALALNAIRKVHHSGFLVFANGAGTIAKIGICMHFEACVWQWCGTLRANSWMYKQTYNCKDSVLSSYLRCFEQVVFNRYHNDRTLLENFFVMMVSLINIFLLMWVLGKLTCVVMELADLKAFHIRLAAYRYTESHNLSRQSFLLMMQSLEIHEHRRRLKESHDAEADLFMYLPEALQVIIHMDARWSSLQGFGFLRDPKVNSYSMFVRRLCHETIYDELCFEHEHVFMESNIAQSMICIERGEAKYYLAEDWKILRASHRRGDLIAEISKGIERPQDDFGKVVSVSQGDVVAEACLLIHSICGTGFDNNPSGS
jgi:hypothetical protein